MDRPWLRHYDPGVPAHIAYEDLPVPQFLERAAAGHPDRVAVMFLNGRLTYRELKDQVDRFATALAALGVVKDSRVAIQLPNLPQTVIAYYATLRLGAQAVFTNPLYTTAEMEHQWKDAGCRVAIVTDFTFDQKIKDHRARLPISAYVIARIPEYLRFPLNLLAPLKLKRQKPHPAIAKVEPGPGIYFFKDLIARTEPRPPAVSISMDDVAVLQYTGGTTGVSKGAMLTHRNLSYNVQQARAWLPGLRDGEEVMLSALPIFHVFGMTVCQNLTVYIAGGMVLLPNPRDIPMLVKEIERRRVTIAPLVPALFNAINNFPGVQRHDLSSVKVCVSGSAPLSVDVQQRFEALTGGKICEGFGLTETSPITHINPLQGLRKIGTIGLPVSDTDCRIVDIESGTRDLPTGTEGELLIRGPQVMLGYWNKPDETANVLKDGWLYTGDLAVMDADGFFKIVGRKKEMIDASGYKVYPDEVDRVLMSQPAVLEAATIGVPHPKRGETVKSFVVLRPGMSATVEELVAHARENLAPYKVPTEVEFRAELPKSAALKILRRELQEEERRKSRSGAA
ncbi:MAG TPA: long-chain fatty acid--CoA ligase [Gemmatimonadales bacterium]|nr:long-chain fatty acid--CoA ligase [Gemmatimonadales bacterium]